jgi:hypothetical protein
LFYDSVIERSISRGEALWKTEREMMERRTLVEPTS